MDMDSQELGQWMAYDSIDPFGLVRQDLHQAYICTILANIHRSKKRPFQLKDFMLRFETKDETPEERAARLAKIGRLLTAQLGGKITGA